MNGLDRGLQWNSVMLRKETQETVPFHVHAGNFEQTSQALVKFTWIIYYDYRDNKMTRLTNLNNRCFDLRQSNLNNT